MKKTFALLLFVLLATTSLFAYTDNFYSTSTDPEYVALISAIKNGQPESVILDAYNTYLSGDKTDVEKARIENHMARYYRDIKKKDEARNHIELMRAKIDAIDRETISDFESKVLEVEYYSAKYYVDKKMADGMKNSELTKELYEKYPDDVFSILTDCWRLIYTPGIAGGSPKKALRILDSFYDDYGSELCDLDIYSVYCAMAVAHNMRKDYEDADKYFNMAFKYYSKEGDIVDTYKANLDELKKSRD